MVNGSPHAPCILSIAREIRLTAGGGADRWTGGLIQPLDRGDFDNRALLAALARIGYRGPVGLMCYGVPDDPRDQLTRSFRTWNRWHAP